MALESPAKWWYECLDEGSPLFAELPGQTKPQHKAAIYQAYLAWARTSGRQQDVLVPERFWCIIRDVLGQLYEEENPRSEHGRVRQLKVPTLQACRYGFCAYVRDSRFFDS